MRITFNARLIRQWLIVSGSIIAVYCLINLVLPYLRLNPSLNTYLIQPFLWLLVVWVVVRVSDRANALRVKNRGDYLQLALIFAFFQIISYAIGGLFSSFGQSPSSFTLTGILGNLFYVGATLIATELSRAWMVNHAGKKHVFLVVILTALFFTFLSQPLGKITGFSLDVKSIPTNGAVWLPALGESLMASFLVMVSGTRASLIYRGLLAAFWWFCPILPDLTWTLKTLIGLLIPIIGMIVVNSVYVAYGIPHRSRKHTRKASFPTGSIVLGIFCVGLVWFVSGALPFQPLMVPTGSMVPVFNPGDVVIVAKMPAAKLKELDIVEYREPKQNINIVHRIIDIQEQDGRKTYITKGDANNAPDADPVPAENVVGKVVFSVPKIGLLSIAIKSLFSFQ